MNRRQRSVLFFLTRGKNSSGTQEIIKKGLRKENICLFLGKVLVFWIGEKLRAFSLEVNASVAFVLSGSR